MAVHPDSAEWPVPYPEFVYKSDIVYKMCTISVNGLKGYTRKEKKIALQLAFAEEEFGEKFQKQIHYLYLVQVASDGSYTYYHRPTRFYGNDFVWYISVGFYDAKTGKFIEKPRYYDVIDMMWLLQKTNPIMYEVFAQKLYNLQNYDIFAEEEELKELNFGVGMPPEQILMVANAGFMEQDNHNSGGRGRRMPYASMPLTKKEMDETFDIENGFFPAREYFRYLFSHHMPFKNAYDYLMDKSNHLSREIILNKNNPQIKFFTKERDFVFSYGFDNHHIIIDSIVLDKNGFHIFLKEEELNQEYLKKWFDEYFGPYSPTTSGKIKFAWGEVSLIDGLVDIKLNQDWEKEEIYKKVQSLKKNKKKKT